MSRPKTAEIPRFYFPGGHKPVPQEVKAEVMGRIDDFFDCIDAGARVLLTRACSIHTIAHAPHTGAMCT